MRKLYLPTTDLSPEIIFSHEEKLFRIKGNSRPENVRDIYEPVVQWLKNYKEYLSEDGSDYNKENPLILQFDLDYFNSSSAKYLYDIVMVLKAFDKEQIPIAITWAYDPADTDSREAGEDLATLAEIDFIFIKKEG